MSARNLYHDAVIAALQTDGWLITHDPLHLKVGDRDLLVDLGAEKPLIGAARGTEKIAVEIQSFLSLSPVADLQQALGQYTMYRLALSSSSRIARCTWRSRKRCTMESCPNRWGSL